MSSQRPLCRTAIGTDSIRNRLVPQVVFLEDCQANPVQGVLRGQPQARVMHRAAVLACVFVVLAEFMADMTPHAVEPAEPAPHGTIGSSWPSRISARGSTHSGSLTSSHRSRRPERL